MPLRKKYRVNKHHQLHCCKLKSSCVKVACTYKRNKLIITAQIVITDFFFHVSQEAFTNRMKADIENQKLDFAAGVVIIMNSFYNGASIYTSLREQTGIHDMIL